MKLDEPFLGLCLELPGTTLGQFKASLKLIMGHVEAIFGNRLYWKLWKLLKYIFVKADSARMCFGPMFNFKDFETMLGHS